jgi:hypothetical protein
MRPEITIAIEQLTWWLIPFSKWVITPVINGISRVYQSTYNWGYKPLTKWDEPPSIHSTGTAKESQGNLPLEFLFFEWFNFHGFF